jgi:hypothetical protein
MIHMHNTLTSGLDPSTAGITKPPVSQAKLDSFRSALSDAVSSTLERFGLDPNQVQVSVTPASTTDTPSSPSTTPPTSSPTTPPDSSTANSNYDPFAQAAHESWAGTNVQPASSSKSSANSWATPTAAADPTLAFDNAYWAQQPAAVQPLRTMPDSERAAYAQQLASEGYKIDVPIMVWGWDPSLVTSMRQADGYTWVPSGLQNPVEMAPGLGSLGNLAAYDPKNPPPGSIAVPPSSASV